MVHKAGCDRGIPQYTSIQLQDEVPAHKSTKLDFYSSIKCTKVNLPKVDTEKDNIVRCNW